MPKRILVIDDDEDILEILNIIFQEEGYNVVLSNNAVAADQVQVIHPDLILLDVRLAGSAKSGTQLCTEIKQKYNDQNIPVLLLSAESNLSFLAKECGADGFIAKPFDINSLLLHVKEYIY